MKPAEYKCGACGKIFTAWVPDKTEILDYYLCQCGEMANRKFTATPYICHQGKCGNSNNGYKSNPVKIKKT